MGKGKALLFVMTATSLCSLLGGCALEQTATSSTEISNAGLSGKVHGGQPPVVGAHVHLLAAGMTGYGAQSVSMLSTGAAGTDSYGGYVLTDGNGNFTLTLSGTCTASTQLYLLATGGNPGLPPGQTNPNLALMAAVGGCPTTGSTTTVVINEVTTIAGAYALAGYMTDLDHLASSGTTQALAGLAAASANAANLASLSSGLALAQTPAGNGTVPQAEINTLADILAGCVNSNGSGCGTLFANATNGSTQPTDTVTAALNIAHNPGANITNLYPLQNTITPFSPTLSTQPNDFTIALSFTGGGLFYPQSIAIDGSNNVWVANYYNVSKLNGITGAAISPAAGYTGNGLTFPFTIAIDQAGNAWVESQSMFDPIGGVTGATTLSVFTPSGGAAFAPITSGGLSTYNNGINDYLSYRNIAFDASGNAWAANAGTGTVSEFSAAGAPLSGTNGYTVGGSALTGVAVDGAGHVWIADNLGNTLYELSASNGSVLFTSTSQQGGLNSPRSIAVDASNNLWLSNFDGYNFLFGNEPGGQTVTESPGAPTSTSGQAFTGGGLDGPVGMAVDGSGNIWATNLSGTASVGTLTELTNAGVAISPATGYSSSALYYPLDVAIDSAGNVWSVSPVNQGVNGGANTNNTSVVEFVGAASPVITPMSLAVKMNKIGVRP